MPAMMAAPIAPTTPDLLDAFTGTPAPMYGHAEPDLDALTVEAVLDAIDDKLETAPADIALPLHRGRRALELELSRLLEA